MSDRLAREPPQIVRALCIDAVIFHLVNTHQAAVVVAIMKASQYGDVETEALSGTLVDVGCLSGVPILEVERRQRHGVMPGNKNDSFACRVAHDEAMINDHFPLASIAISLARSTSDAVSFARRYWRHSPSLRVLHNNPRFRSALSSGKDKKS